VTINPVYMGAPSGGPAKPAAYGTKVYLIFHAAGGQNLSVGDIVRLDTFCTVEGTPVSPMPSGHLSSNFVIPGEYDYSVLVGQFVYDITDLYVDGNSVDFSYELYWINDGDTHNAVDDEVASLELLIVTGAVFKKIYVNVSSGSIDQESGLADVVVWSHHGYWTSGVYDLSGPSWSTLLVSPTGSVAVGVSSHWYDASPGSDTTLEYNSTTARRVVYALWFDTAIEPKKGVPLWALGT
jgi:hypothetical protein